MDGYGYPAAGQYPPAPASQPEYGPGIVQRPPSRTNSQPPPGKYENLFFIIRLLTIVLM